MSALEGLADEFGEAEHVADVPTAEVRYSATATAFWQLDAGGGAVHSITSGHCNEQS